MKKYCYLLLLSPLLFAGCKKDNCVTVYDAVTSKIEIVGKETVHTFLFLNNKSFIIAEAIEVRGYTSDKEIIKKITDAISKRKAFDVCIVWEKIVKVD